MKGKEKLVTYVVLGACIVVRTLKHKASDMEADSAHDINVLRFLFCHLIQEYVRKSILCQLLISILPLPVWPVCA